MGISTIIDNITRALGRDWWWPSNEHENVADGQYVHVSHAAAAATDDDDRICMSRSEYERLTSYSQNNTRNHVHKETVPYYSVGERDRHVLYDDLYPAYGRSAAHNYDPRFFRRMTNIPTQFGREDTYRLVGYLTNNSAAIQTWKLFGKQSHRNRADFYMTPAMAGYDVKIQLTDDVVNGREKLRDMDTIPSEITINSPILDSGYDNRYTFVELPKSDLRDMFYY